MEMNIQERSVLMRQLGIIEGAACGITDKSTCIFGVIMDANEVIDKLIKGEESDE